MEKDKDSERIIDISRREAEEKDKYRWVIEVGGRWRDAEKGEN